MKQLILQIYTSGPFPHNLELPPLSSACISAWVEVSSANTFYDNTLDMAEILAKVNGKFGYSAVESILKVLKPILANFRKLAEQEAFLVLVVISLESFDYDEERSRLLTLSPVSTTILVEEKKDQKAYN